MPPRYDRSVCQLPDMSAPIRLAPSAPSALSCFSKLLRYTNPRYTTPERIIDRFVVLRYTAPRYSTPSRSFARTYARHDDHNKPGVRSCLRQTADAPPIHAGMHHPHDVRHTVPYVTRVPYVTEPASYTLHQTSPCVPTALLAPFVRSTPYALRMHPSYSLPLHHTSLPPRLPLLHRTQRPCHTPTETTSYNPAPVSFADHTWARNVANRTSAPPADSKFRISPAALRAYTTKKVLGGQLFFGPYPSYIYTSRHRVYFLLFFPTPIHSLPASTRGDESSLALFLHSKENDGTSSSPSMGRVEHVAAKAPPSSASPTLPSSPPNVCFQVRSSHNVQVESDSSSSSGFHGLPPPGGTSTAWCSYAAPAKDHKDPDAAFLFFQPSLFGSSASTATTSVATFTISSATTAG